MFGIVLLAIQLKSFDTWHADASELSDAVEASGIVLAGHGQTFIDVNFAAWAGVTPTALALEGALRVDALPKMFAWIGTCGLKDAVWYFSEHPKMMMTRAYHKRTDNCC